MKVLLLGGIAESKVLAQELIQRQHQVVYSIVGLVRTPQLDCEIRIGGFSNADQDGIEGMVHFCKERKIDLLVDASHPYAVDISAHAIAAAQQSGIECWRYQRPGWDVSNYSGWHLFSDMTKLWSLISSFNRPFFTIGASALEHVEQRANYQHWIVRTAQEMPQHEGVTQINRIGPFYYTDELDIMREYSVDALISKDSGCQRVAGKLDAAKTLGLPVFVHARPTLEEPHREFSDILTLVASLP